MSLIDDAKRLAKASPHCSDHDDCVLGWPDDPEEPYAPCAFCGINGDHKPDCPWLAIPSIVAGLAAAERVVDTNPLTMDLACHFCQGCLGVHAADCPWLALVTALKKG